MKHIRPTIRALAEKTGYSKSTVSMALNDDERIALATRRRIQRIAARMGYVHNPVVAHLMAELSQSRTQTYKATLALLNIEPNPHAFEGTGTVHDWVAGCERRAAELGYRLDRFWLHEPGLTPASLARILRARSITGVLIINSCAAPALPESFNPIWESFACLVVGNRITEPPLNLVCNDQYLTTLEAVKKVAALGFKRPGLVMCESLDENVELKFSAGYQKGVALMYGRSPLPVIAPAIREMHVFQAWLKAHKPDVVIAINDWPAEWAKKLKLAVPRDLSLVNLDRREALATWAGMDQNSEAIGAVAVEQLIGQIHRNERGIPPVAKCVLIESTWRDGASLRTKAK